MSLVPDNTERLARARADLRIGLPVVLRDQDELLLTLAVETLSQDRLDAICALGGTPHLAITARRAQTLKARAYDGDLARITIPKGASLTWLNAVADPADDLQSPMKGPLIAMRDGKADLDRLSLRILKTAHLLPAALSLPVDTAPEGLTVLEAIPTLKVLEESSPQHPVIGARVPLAVSQKSRLHVFRPEDGGEEHYAIEIGRPARDKPVLARLHSACFTGDVLGSLKCDCGPQLRGAMTQMADEGAGVLLYLNQEGRGIGLANKMRAYSLQDQGFDTVEANHRLGFEDDERDFRIGAALLKEMGFSTVRLLTNNPAKIAMMERNGIAVEDRVPLKVGENPFNSQYLATKAKKSGHLL